MQRCRMRKAARKRIRLETARLILRNARVEDASEEWGRWTADPTAGYMLNAPMKVSTKTEVEAYIRMFDHRTHLLLVIVEKVSEKIIGCFRIDIDDRHSRFLVSVIVGEPDYRRKGILNELRVPFRDYFFETLGLKVMLCTVLSHNEPMIRYLEKTGWQLAKKIERHIQSRVSDAKYDLCFFSQTAEGWRAWKRANLPYCANH